MTSENAAGAAATDKCAHDWRRGPADPLHRYYVKACVLCGMYGTGYDWTMPEPNTAEQAALKALIPPPTPRRRPSLRFRLGSHVQRVRVRLASVVAGFDVNGY